MRRVSCASTSRSSISRVSSSARSIASLRDLVEHHPPHRDLRLQHLEQMPGDRLALAVFVRREQELVGDLEQLLQLGDLLPLVGVDDVEGLEVVVDVDAEARPALLLVLLRDVGRALGQIADVTDARLDDEAVAEVALDRLGLRRGLDDDEASVLCVLCHRRVTIARVSKRSNTARMRPPALYSLSPWSPGLS